jgi:peptidoglycan/xylan/chitin deacetylase (PgdA/CDA1 family)
MVDEAVRRHPEFSADGAKGLLALTGYEGLFGEQDLTAPAARQRVLALARALRSTGWTFASHTYGHLDLSRNGWGIMQRDTRRWRDLARPLIGPVDILVYPFGARPDRALTADLVRAGFPIQLDIDIRAKHEQYAGAIIMSRRHVDGFAFDVPSRQRPFYDVAVVRDSRRPPG